MEYTERLCAALATNTHLTELDVEECGITDPCCEKVRGGTELAPLSMPVSIQQQFGTAVVTHCACIMPSWR